MHTHTCTYTHMHTCAHAHMHTCRPFNQMSDSLLVALCNIAYYSILIPSYLSGPDLISLTPRHASPSLILILFTQKTPPLP